MSYTRYTTQSGSAYDVKIVDGATLVRRTRLGQKHYDRGPAYVAKRDADGIQAWRAVLAFETFGVGHILRIKLAEGDHQTLITTPVVRIDVRYEDS